MKIEADKFYTVEEVAEFLRVSRHTVYRMMLWAEKLKSTKTERRRLILGKDLQEYISK